MLLLKKEVEKRFKKIKSKKSIFSCLNIFKFFEEVLVGLNFGSQKLASESYQSQKYRNLEKKSVNKPTELKPTFNKLKL